MADLFKLQLSYDAPAGGGTAQYNGNISTMQWRTYIGTTCLAQQQYRFSYDAANRLTAADHYTNSSGSWTFTNNYTESNITYDLNGNLKTYTRRGLTSGTSTFGVIDNLTYAYSATIPDRLIAMTDAGNITRGFKYKNSIIGDHYLYDANGNLTQDKHKDLTIAYNHLNLPHAINNLADEYILLTYTADGEKLTKLAGGVTKNYVAGIEYAGANLEAIYHAEGRCTPNGSNFYYEYTLKDHLGNARVHWRANGTAVTFLEELHYYPFGMLMEGIGTAAVTVNAYKYNSKELNTDLGLNWSDYGARWYDASVGRWWSVDPLAEKYAQWSPFNYTLNNPLRFIDPDGMDPGDLIILFTGHQLSSNNQPTTQILGDQLKKYSTGTFLQINSSNYYDSGKFANEAATAVAEHFQNNPTGRIVMIGYSLGGELAMQTQSKLSESNTRVDLLYTIDGTGRKSEERSSVVESNVKENINYFQINQTGDYVKDKLNLHGGPNQAVDPAQTHVINNNMSYASYNGEQITHYNIDGLTMTSVLIDVLSRTESGITSNQLTKIRDTTSHLTAILGLQIIAIRKTAKRSNLNSPG